MRPTNPPSSMPAPSVARPMTSMVAVGAPASAAIPIAIPVSTTMIDLIPRTPFAGGSAVLACAGGARSAARRRTGRGGRPSVHTAWTGSTVRSWGLCVAEDDGPAGGADGPFWGGMYAEAAGC